MDYRQALNIIRDTFTKCNGTYLVTSDCHKEKVRLFISTSGVICKFANRSRKKGYAISQETISTWTAILPVELSNDEHRTVRKFIRLAAKATFPSAFVRKCLNADIDKGCYDNRLTTGCAIDGKIITLECISRYAPYEVYAFKKALQERKPYRSTRFSFQGYEGTLWLEIAEIDDGYNKPGDIAAGFSKEYKDCLNGYYYALINDDTFIGVDKD